MQKSQPKTRKLPAEPVPAVPMESSPEYIHRLKKPAPQPITLKRARDGLERYGTVLGVDLTNVRVLWNGTNHVFSRSTGMVIESEHGIMANFGIAPAEYARFSNRGEDVMPEKSDV